MSESFTPTPCNSPSASFKKPKIANKNQTKDKTNDQTNIVAVNHESNQETYYKMRETELGDLATHDIPVYPHKFIPSTEYELISNPEYVRRYSEIENGSHHETVKIALMGRVDNKRNSSAKLSFIDLTSESTKVQLLMNLKMYGNQNNPDSKVQKNMKGDLMDKEEHFKLMNPKIRIGDLIGVVGYVFKSPPGELSLMVHTITLLAPCLYILSPEMTDPETRFRQRYLDLLVNKQNRDIFVKRSKIIRGVRNYLESLNFLEVDTPILNVTVGGANARPFKTHSNDFDMEMSMRIAPELYLKQLIIGGYERVFELGRQFRNEGNDPTHNSEFTSMECYGVNLDYIGLMELGEKMLTKIVLEVNGSYIVKYNGKEIDFTPPFKRIDILPELQNLSGIVLPDDLSTDDARNHLDDECKRLSIECSNPRTTARLLDKLIGHYLEPLCLNPTFLVGQPLIMSPLAKNHRFNPFITERFELFINFMEFANAYTELNDPHEQKKRFEGQAKDKANGDDEAMVLDKDFVKALEYGLPPTGGFGLGIDRLCMLLTDNQSIREVIFFPTMKPVE